MCVKKDTYPKCHKPIILNSLYFLGKIVGFVIQVSIGLYGLPIFVFL